MAQEPAIPNPKGAKRRLSMAEREEISPWRGRRRLLPGDRQAARASTVNGVAGTGQKRRPWLLPGPGRRRRRVSAGPAAQGGQAGGRVAAAGGGGGQASVAVVASADRRLVAAGPPSRSGDAGVARDDLPVCSSRAAARSVGSCSVACAPGGRCAIPEPSAYPRASSATPSTSASGPPRLPIGPCLAIGKATWSSAGDPARWGPWWSTAAAMCCCSRSLTVHCRAHEARVDPVKIGWPVPVI
jgi:hypothetical protein